MGVTVALEGVAEFGGRALEDGLAVALHALLELLLEVLEVGRDLPAEGFLDDLLGGLADALEVAEAAGGRPLPGLSGGQLPQDPGGGAEGPDPVGGLAHLLQQVGDAVEGGDGIHGLFLPPGQSPPQPPPATIVLTMPEAARPVSEP